MRTVVRPDVLRQLALAALGANVPWIDGRAPHKVADLMSASGVSHQADYTTDGPEFEGDVWLWPNPQDPQQIAVFSRGRTGPLRCQWGQVTPQFHDQPFEGMVPVGLARSVRKADQVEAEALASQVYERRDTFFEGHDAATIAGYLCDHGLTRFDVNGTHFFVFSWSSAQNMVGCCMPDDEGYIAFMGEMNHPEV